MITHAFVRDVISNEIRKYEFKKCGSFKNIIRKSSRKFNKTKLEEEYKALTENTEEHSNENTEEPSNENAEEPINYSNERKILLKKY